MLMTEARGASNRKAKEELGWTLRHPEPAPGLRGRPTAHHLTVPDMSQGLSLGHVRYG